MIKNKAYILLFLLIVFHIINNIVVLKQDLTLINVDSFNYYGTSINLYYDLIKKTISIKEIILKNFYYQVVPPVYILTTIPWYFLLGIEQDIACYSNFLYIIILIVALFLLGRYYSNDYYGVLSAFIVMCYPVVFGLSRWYMSYFASLSMVTLTVYFLIRK